MPNPNTAMHLLRRHSKEPRHVATKPGSGDGRCKRHPKHRQSPGVCSLCLREKLLHLDAPARIAATSSRGSSSATSSASTSYSSSLGSSRSSPPRKVLALFGGHMVGALKKSRSLAFAPTSTRQARGAIDDVTKENTGFWSKLMNKNKRTDHRARLSLGMHSKTVRERSSLRLEH